jgi:hypothetical protein
MEIQVQELHTFISNVVQHLLHPTPKHALKIHKDDTSKVATLP